MPFLALRQEDGSTQEGSGEHDIVSEIQCYSLPFGALGFVSHILTYYTVLCLWFGRRPLMPWRPLNHNSKWVMAKDIISLIITTSMTINTLVKCKQTWQLQAVAVWKLTVSLLVGITPIHASWIILSSKTNQEDWLVTRERLKVISRWGFLYIPGMFAGMIGLMSIVTRYLHLKTVEWLTALFFTGVALAIIAKLGYDYGPYGKNPDVIRPWLWSFVMALGVFTILAALYSDWVLGVITENLLGMPTKFNAGFYWTYFVAKRIPMFSW